MLNKIKHIVHSKKHQLYVLCDQALVSGVNFLIAILLTRFMGLEEFGVFATAWMLVLFFSSVQQAVIVAPMYTLHAKSEEKSVFLSQAFNLQLLFTVLSMLVALVVVLIVFYFNNTWYRAGVFYSLPLVVGAFLMQDFFRRKNFVENNGFIVLVSDIIAYGFQPVLVVVLYVFDLLTIHSFFMGLFGLMIVVSIVQYFLAEKERFSHQTVQLFKAFWGFSKHLFFTSILQWFSGNYFIVFATGVLGPLAIGVIRIAQNLMGVLHILFLALENLIPIQASKILTKNGKEPTLNFFKQMTIKTGLMTVLILVLIAVFRGPIIELVYGAEYLIYDYIIIGFAVIYIFIFLGTILRFVIRTFEENRIVLENYIITGLFSFLTAGFFVANYQLNGVLVGLLLVQVVSLFYMLIRLAAKLKTK
ncbi:MAG: oligosaccharide flippase family protein [Flavobacteriales bacterium]|jgi:O-antigen/teichoic acid export membrane protein|nr:oligosaccharide flippase family protein [Flavobacteriales bacterium]